MQGSTSLCSPKSEAGKYDTKVPVAPVQHFDVTPVQHFDLEKASILPCRPATPDSISPGYRAKKHVG